MRDIYTLKNKAQTDHGILNTSAPSNILILNLPRPSAPTFISNITHATFSIWRSGERVGGGLVEVLRIWFKRKFGYKKMLYEMRLSFLQSNKYIQKLYHVQPPFSLYKNKYIYIYI